MKNITLTLLMCLALTACQANSKDQIMGSKKSQVELRAFQAKAFNTSDQNKTLRTVMATLQDLGFVIDKADNDLGSVSGTKLDGYALKMTVTVTPKGKSKMVVRANAQYNIYAVEDPRPYQQFFTALEKSMFLKAQDVD